MNKELIYDQLVAWEHNAGESFLDQGFDLHPLTFMTWCLGKGYLSSENYNKWSEDYVYNKLEAIDANYFVYSASDYVGDDSPYAVVTSEEWNEEDQEKANRILAEFISEIDIYIERFKEFVEAEE